jgi:4-amino-4-deoxy-L-arabinose transferase-like glycosyltransferase
VRVFTFIISANFGADSISRSLISLNWSFDPFFIWHPNSETSVWLPLQFYINGLSLMIWDNVQMAPRLVSLIVSLISIPVFWGVARRLFDQEKAYFATACFSLYSLHIKSGNIAGSESLFIITFLAVIYAYHSYLLKRTTLSMSLLSIAMLLAVMIRFEAWLLPMFITIALMIRGWKWEADNRRILIHAVFASILPAIFIILWMYGSYRDFGDILYSVHAASAEHIDLSRQSISALGATKALAYKAAFWPGVLILSLSPLIMIGGLWGLILSLIRRIGIEWTILFVIQVMILLYQSLIAGSLAPLARYTILPGTILCLYAGWGWFDLAARIRPFGRKNLKIHIALVSMLIWTLALCPNYRDSENPYLRKISSVSPVTQYPAFIKPVIDWLKTNLRPDQSIIFNSPAFASNAIIMYSGITPEQFVAVNENSPEDVKRKLLGEKPSYFMCHRDAPLKEVLNLGDMKSDVALEYITLQYSSNAGDFSIYTPKYEPEDRR